MPLTPVLGFLSEQIGIDFTGAQLGNIWVGRTGEDETMGVLGNAAPKYFGCDARHN